MRIVYLCLDDGIPLDGFKGASTHVREMIRALAALGHEVIAIVARGNAVDFPSNVNLEILGDNLLVNTAISAMKDIDARLPIARDVEKVLMPLAHQAHIMKLLQRFQPEVLYERYTLFSWTGITLAEELGVPLILEINAPLSQEAARWRRLELVQMAENIEAEIFRRADVRIAVSEILRTYVSERVGHPHKTLVLPNGVDTERFSPRISGQSVRSHLQLPNTSFIVGYVGGFKKWQDLETLLKAFFSFSLETDNSYLLLVGEGPTKSETRQLAKQLNIEEFVRFAGPVQHVDVPSYIAAMDVAVSPFKAIERFYFSPLKVFEYMSMGKCVVASKLGQMAELIDHGQNGWLITPECPEEMEVSLRTLFENAELRHAIGLKGRETVVSNHSWSHNARTITEILEVQVKG